MNKTIEERYKTTPLSGGNAPFVEHYYEIFLADPGAGASDENDRHRNLFESRCG